MFKNSLLHLAALLSTVAVANAATISVEGVHQLQPGATGQKIDIMVSGGEMITGAQVYATIGNGDLTKDEPVFTGIDFSDSIFKVHPATPQGAGPIAGVEQFLEKGIAFNISGDQVPADGKIATLELSTAGFSAGQTFPLLLSWENTAAGGGPSTLAGFGGNFIPATIRNGRVELVPEPSTVWMLLGLLAALPLARAARRRVGRAP